MLNALTVYPKPTAFVCARRKAGLIWVTLFQPVMNWKKFRAEARAHPLVLFIRYEIYARAGKWDMAAEVSNALTKILPDEPTAWAFLAYATRRKTGGSIAQAKLILEAEPKFPSEYHFPFNLACYCAQLHQLDEAEKWLEKAIEIDTEIVRKPAIDDPDLKPLWDSMTGTLRKQE